MDHAVSAERAGDRARASASGLLVGLIGRGIGRSRTPRMHEVEAERQGLALSYRLLDADKMGAPRPDFATVLRQAEEAGFAGVNVTHPYKREALEHLDAISASAEAVGAVNTIVFEQGRRVGHNTDCWGFAQSFRQGLAGAARERALLLGAGGAGGAVAQALLEEGVARLMIHDSSEESAEALAARLGERWGAGKAVLATELAAAAGEADGIVNATPVGMASHPGSALPTPLLEPRHWVADIVYFPIETHLLWAARERGCRTLSGAGMAVFQAVRAFELFTGLEADPAQMRATFRALDD